MERMNEQALRNAASSTRLMIAALLVAVILAIASARYLTRLIREPIVALTQATRAVSQGNLDQVVPATTSDELGELGQTFNTMARTIREYREAGSLRLLRRRRPPRQPSTRSPTPWSWSIPRERLSASIRPLRVSSRRLPEPTASRCPGPRRLAQAAS